MRKSILTLSLVLLASGAPAWGASTDTITVTVSLEEVVSVSLDANTWTIGAIALSGTDSSPTFTATNDGNVVEDISILASNSAGGWTLGTAGADTFQVDETNSVTTLTTSAQMIASDVALSGTVTIDLDYTAPSSDTLGGGVDHSFTVTVSAAAATP